jgi:exodeoxyribonuclease-3
MRLVSFNINGLRARFHQLDALKKLQPDVIGLQEIKVDDSQYPLETVSDLGFISEHHGQKGHYGVANLTLGIKPIEVVRGFPNDAEDAQKRFIRSVFKTDTGKDFTFMNGYFPQGEGRSHETKFPAKMQFYADLLALLENNYTPDDLIAVVGDFNIAPFDTDIGIKPENAKRWLKTGKCAFLPEEREWMERLNAWGLTDSYRHLYPDVTDRYSWFDYRSRAFEDTPKRGLRIDHIMVTKPLLDLLTESDVSYDIRDMEKPSDHAPVFADFTLKLL